MGKKKNKNKAKKVSIKRERYTKFRKEKPSSMTVFMPDLPEDATAMRRQDEQRISDFWRHYRRPPQRFIRERDAKAKR